MMNDWDWNVDDCIEWADGSVDAVWTNAETGEAEFRPASPAQIGMWERHKQWIADGKPDVFIPLSELLQ